MEQVIDRLYVGSDRDFERLKDKPGWSVLRCCKEGPGGHRQTLSYTTQGAPKGPEYLSASANANHLALNFIDPHDPNFIRYEMAMRGLDFIHGRIEVGDKVLVACNAGKSRGPTMALLYLRATGELPGNFVAAERVFHTLCQNYEPGIGMRQFAKSRWNEFENAVGERTNNEW